MHLLESQLIRTRTRCGVLPARGFRQRAAFAVARCGYAHQIIGNIDFAYPTNDAAITTHADKAALRKTVVARLSADARHVLAPLNLVPCRWMPEWSILTGYDDGGGTIIGWPPFHDFGDVSDQLPLGPDGRFHKPSWEDGIAELATLIGEQ